MDPISTSWTNLLMDYIDKTKLDEINKLFKRFEDKILSKDFDFSELKIEIKKLAPEILDEDYKLIEERINNIKHTIITKIDEAKSLNINSADFQEEFDQIGNIDVLEKRNELLPIVETNLSYQTPVSVEGFKDSITNIKETRNPFFTTLNNINLFEGLHGLREFIDEDVNTDKWLQFLKDRVKVFKLFIDSNIKVMDFSINFEQNLYNITANYDNIEKVNRIYIGKIFLSNLQEEDKNIEARLVIYNADNDPIANYDSTIGPEFYFKCFKKDGYLYLFCDNIEIYRLMGVYTAGDFTDSDLHTNHYHGIDSEEVSEGINHGFGRNIELSSTNYTKWEERADSVKNVIPDKPDIDEENKFDSFVRNRSSIAQLPHENDFQFNINKQYDTAKTQIPYGIGFIGKAKEVNNTSPLFNDNEINISYLIKTNNTEKDNVINDIDAKLVKPTKTGDIIGRDTGLKIYNNKIENKFGKSGVSQLGVNSVNLKIQTANTPSLFNNIYLKDKSIFKLSTKTNGDLGFALVNDIIKSDQLQSEIRKLYEFEVVQDINDDSKWISEIDTYTKQKEKTLLKLTYDPKTNYVNVETDANDYDISIQPAGLVETTEKTIKGFKLRALAEGAAHIVVKATRLDHLETIQQLFVTIRNTTQLTASPLDFKISYDETSRNYQIMNINTEAFTFEYEFSNPDIIFFDKNTRKITGLKEGETILTITALADGYKVMNKYIIPIKIVECPANKSGKHIYNRSGDLFGYCNCGKQNPENGDTPYSKIDSLYPIRLNEEEKNLILGDIEIPNISGLHLEVDEIREIEKEPEENKFEELFKFSGLIDKRYKIFMLKRDFYQKINDRDYITPNDKEKAFQKIINLNQVPSSIDKINDRMIIFFVKTEITDLFKKEICDTIETFKIDENELVNFLFLNGRKIDLTNYPEYEDLYNKFIELDYLTADGNVPDTILEINAISSEEMPLMLTKTEEKLIKIKTNAHSYQIESDSLTNATVEKADENGEFIFKITALKEGKAKITIKARSNEGTEKVIELFTQINPQPETSISTKFSKIIMKNNTEKIITIESDAGDLVVTPSDETKLGVEKVENQVNTFKLISKVEDNSLNIRITGTNTEAFALEKSVQVPVVIKNTTTLELSYNEITKDLPKGGVHYIEVISNIEDFDYQNSNIGVMRVEKIENKLKITGTRDGYANLTIFVLNENEEKTEKNIKYTVRSMTELSLSIEEEELFLHREDIVDIDVLTNAKLYTSESTQISVATVLQVNNKIQITALTLGDTEIIIRAQAEDAIEKIIRLNVHVVAIPQTELDIGLADGETEFDLQIGFNKRLTIKTNATEFSFEILEGEDFSSVVKTSEEILTIQGAKVGQTRVAIIAKAENCVETRKEITINVTLVETRLEIDKNRFNLVKKEIVYVGIDTNAETYSVSENPNVEYIKEATRLGIKGKVAGADQTTTITAIAKNGTTKEVTITYTVFDEITQLEVSPTDINKKLVIDSRQVLEIIHSSADYELVIPEEAKDSMVFNKEKKELIFLKEFTGTITFNATETGKKENSVSININVTKAFENKTEEELRPLIEKLEDYYDKLKETENDSEEYNKIIKDIVTNMTDIDWNEDPDTDTIYQLTKQLYAFLTEVTSHENDKDNEQIIDYCNKVPESSGIKLQENYLKDLDEIRKSLDKINKCKIVKDHNAIMSKLNDRIKMFDYSKVVKYYEAIGFQHREFIILTDVFGELMDNPDSYPSFNKEEEMVEFVTEANKELEKLVSKLPEYFELREYSDYLNLIGKHHTISPIIVLRKKIQGEPEETAEHKTTADVSQWVDIDAIENMEFQIENPDLVAISKSDDNKKIYFEYRAPGSTFVQISIQKTIDSELRTEIVYVKIHCLENRYDYVPIELLFNSNEVYKYTLYKYDISEFNNVNTGQELIENRLVQFNEHCINNLYKIMYNEFFDVKYIDEDYIFDRKLWFYYNFDYKNPENEFEINVSLDILPEYLKHIEVYNKTIIDKIIKFYSLEINIDRWKEENTLYPLSTLDEIIPDKLIHQSNIELLKSILDKYKAEYDPDDISKYDLYFTKKLYHITNYKLNDVSIRRNLHQILALMIAYRQLLPEHKEFKLFDLVDNKKLNTKSIYASEVYYHDVNLYLNNKSKYDIQSILDYVYTLYSTDDIINCKITKDRYMNKNYYKAKDFSFNNEDSIVQTQETKVTLQMALNYLLKILLDKTEVPNESNQAIIDSYLVSTEDSKNIYYEDNYRLGINNVYDMIHYLIKYKDTDAKYPLMNPRKSICFKLSETIPVEDEKIYDETGQKVYYSDDNGNTWNYSDDVLPYGIDIKDGGWISRTSYNNNVLYLFNNISNNKIIKTEDGLTYQEIEFREELSDESFVVDLQISSNGDFVILIDNLGRMYYSNDNGNTWKRNIDARFGATWYQYNILIPTDRFENREQSGIVISSEDIYIGGRIGIWKDNMKYNTEYLFDKDSRLFPRIISNLSNPPTLVLDIKSINNNKNLEHLLIKDEANLVNFQGEKFKDVNGNPVTLISNTASARTSFGVDFNIFMSLIDTSKFIIDNNLEVLNYNDIKSLLEENEINISEFAIKSGKAGLVSLDGFAYKSNNIIPNIVKKRFVNYITDSDNTKNIILESTPFLEKINNYIINKLNYSEKGKILTHIQLNTYFDLPNNDERRVEIDKERKFYSKIDGTLSQTDFTYNKTENINILQFDMVGVYYSENQNESNNFIRYCKDLTRFKNNLSNLVLTLEDLVKFYNLDYNILKRVFFGEDNKIKVSEKVIDPFVNLNESNILYHPTEVIITLYPTDVSSFMNFKQSINRSLFDSSNSGDIIFNTEK